MSVTIKTQHEIELMREAGHLLEKVHDGLIPYFFILFASFCH